MKRYKKWNIQCSWWKWIYTKDQSVNFIYKNCLIKIIVAIALVGGPSTNAGHVYARNPQTGYYGPVCDDGFGDLDVRKLKFLFFC